MNSEIAFRLEPIASLGAVEDEWRELERITQPSFFTSWHWIGTLLAALPQTSRPRLLRGTAGSRTVALALVGAAVTRRRGGLIRSRGLYLNETGDPRFDSLMIEHNGVLTPAGCEDAVSDALLAWFAERYGEVDELHLAGSRRPLPQTAVERRGLRHAEIAVPSYWVDLCRLKPSDHELYPILSANARQQLRRAIRSFGRCGALRVTEAATLVQALAFFSEMKRLHCLSWQRRGKPHAFAAAFFESFHTLLITRTFGLGAIQLLRVCAGERDLGYLYNFRSAGRVYAYQTGFADSEPRESPGMVAHAFAIQHAFRSGARVYDFMAGSNRLKQRFSTHCEPMLWQVVQQPLIAFRLEDLARRLRHSFDRGHRAC